MTKHELNRYENDLISQWELVTILSRHLLQNKTPREPKTEREHQYKEPKDGMSEAPVMEKISFTVKKIK